MAMADGPVEYRPYWPPTKLMSSVVTTGVVLSSVSSAPAEEIGIDVGYENRCEPTMGPGQEPNLPGGERSRAMPNTGLQSGDCTTFPYLNVPGIDLNFTASLQNTAPACGSSVFDFDMPYQTFYTGWYGTDIPPQFFNLDYQPYYDGSDEHTLEYDGSATLSSPHSDIPLPLGLDIGPYQHQPFHDPSVFMPIMAENSFQFLPVNEFDQSGDDSDQYSIVGFGSTYSSCPSQSSLHSGIQDESYQMVQHGAPPATGQYSPTGIHGIYSPSGSSHGSVVSLPNSIQDEPFEMVQPVGNFDCLPTTEVFSSTPPSEPSRKSSSSPRAGKTKKLGRRSRALTPGQRDQAGKTRLIGACRRCAWQRNQCKPNPANPKGPCMPCSKILMNYSKKVLHHCPCVRWKLTDTVLFRTGGLNFTTRQGWEGAAIRDMGPGDWADDVIHTIKLTLGYCKNPIVLQVRRFKPVKGVDVTSRFWLDPHGQQQETEIAPFALADIKKHRKVLESHVIENAYDAVKQYAEDPRVHWLVGKTYKAAWDHMRETTYKSSDVDTKEFMELLFKLWFAMKNTLGSAWLLGTPGEEETLYMKPDERKGHPFPGKISAPRLVCQQFDALNYNFMLNQWKREFLSKLNKIISAKIDPNMLYTVYLAVFILLHEVSATSKDRYWHARNKKTVERRYDMELFMEELHEGANKLLYAWHYYKCGFNPLDADWVKVESNDPTEVTSSPKPKKSPSLAKAKKAFCFSRSKKAFSPKLKKMTIPKLMKGKKPDEVPSKIWAHLKDNEVWHMRLLAELCNAKTVPMTPSEETGWPGLYFDPNEPNPLIWERDLHFVSQMFHDWECGPLWSRAIDHGQPLKF
ncbi:hypothetical protein BJ166DRAFT_598133 [Pestalotiopsis sp. NC0098]|nr:hypothetical protein BJ166DRAFT_598133 [Pestalotiopsis sp. NC0098]